MIAYFLGHFHLMTPVHRMPIGNENRRKEAAILEGELFFSCRSRQRFVPVPGFAEGEGNR
jgi:hypothetical protein